MSFFDCGAARTESVINFFFTEENRSWHPNSQSLPKCG